MRTFLKTFKIVVLFFISYLLVSHQSTWSWWFNATDQETLQKALTSDNPGTVEKCLDKFIKKHNYSAILQIKHHARTMIMTERRKLNNAINLNPAVIKKRIAPWARIEQKANQFFKRTAVRYEVTQNAAP